MWNRFFRERNFFGRACSTGRKRGSRSGCCRRLRGRLLGGLDGIRGGWGGGLVVVVVVEERNMSLKGKRKRW